MADRCPQHAGQPCQYGDEIKETRDAVLEMRGDVRHMLGDFSEMRGKVHKLDEAIRGNGKPGLERRMETVEQYIGGKARLGWIAATALITALISSTVSAIITHAIVRAIVGCNG